MAGALLIALHGKRPPPAKPVTVNSSSGLSGVEPGSAYAVVLMGLYEIKSLHSLLDCIVFVHRFSAADVRSPGTPQLFLPQLSLSCRYLSATRL